MAEATICERCGEYEFDCPCLPLELDGRWVKAERLQVAERERDQWRAAANSAYDEACSVHDDPPLLQDFKSYLAYRMGTYGHAVSVEGYQDVVAERDAAEDRAAELEAALREMLGSYRSLAAGARAYGWTGSDFESWDGPTMARSLLGDEQPSSKGKSAE